MHIDCLADIAYRNNCPSYSVSIDRNNESCSDSLGSRSAGATTVISASFSSRMYLRTHEKEHWCVAAQNATDVIKSNIFILSEFNPSVSIPHLQLIPGILNADKMAITKKIRYFPRIAFVLCSMLMFIFINTLSWQNQIWLPCYREVQVRKQEHQDNIIKRMGGLAVIVMLSSSLCLGKNVWGLMIKFRGW